MRAASSYSKIGEMWPRSNGPVTQNGFELKGSTLKMSYQSFFRSQWHLSHAHLQRAAVYAPQILAILKENKVKLSH